MRLITVSLSIKTTNQRKKTGLPGLRLGKRNAMSRVEERRIVKRNGMTLATLSFLRQLEMNHKIRQLLENKEFAEELRKHIRKNAKRGRLVGFKLRNREDQVFGWKRSGLPKLRLGKRSDRPYLRFNMIKTLTI